MIWAVGIGPGDPEALTGEARAVLSHAEVVIGYRPYLEFLGDLVADKLVEATGMRKEVERCRRALELHRQGRRVAVVSSGDAGIYGMAGLLMELDPEADVQVVPGVTACQAAAARLGAPLMNDFAVLSLSDLLTPREEVLRRVSAVAAADLVTCLYNPTSRRRRPLFEEAVRRFTEHRGAATPVGWVRNAYREDEEVHLTTLAELPGEAIDMWTMVIIGSSRTELVGGRLVTRRGYREKYLEEEDAVSSGTAAGSERSGGTGALAEAGETPEPIEAPPGGNGARGRVYLIGGTSFARGVAEHLEAAGWAVRLSVAGELGAAELERVPSGGVQIGRLDELGLVGELQRFGADALVDASHPYAVEAHHTARAAAEAAAVPLVRAARPPWQPPAGDSVRFFASAGELASALTDLGRRPFFTVGAKGLRSFPSVAGGAARVLPTAESVSAAAEAGFPPERILAAYPPFGAAFTAGVLERYGCDVIVSKESGREGGLDEKAEAARLASAELWVLARPPEPDDVCRDAAAVAGALSGLAAGVASAAGDTAGGSGGPRGGGSG